MKKFSVLLALVLSFTMFATACGKNIENTNDSSISSSQGENESSSDSSETSGGTISTDTMELSKSRYGYSTLSDDEKEIYDKILAAVYNFDSTVDFGKEVSYETYKKVFMMLYFQETQLFWLFGKYSPDDFVSGTATSTSLFYNFVEDQAAAHQGEIDTKINEIISSFPSDATDFEKLEIIHDYIGTHCSFDMATSDNQTIYGAFVLGKVQCEGYAKSMGYLCDMAGIKNLLVVGHNNKEESHAWNMVNLDNEWYNIDITWDDPKGHDDTFIMHSYFNVSDAEILNISHFVDLEYTLFTPPTATATKQNYFIVKSMCASSSDEALTMLENEMIESAKIKDQVAEIKCSSSEVYESAHATILNKVLDMQKAANATDGASQITALADGSDANTMVIRINLTY